MDLYDEDIREIKTLLDNNEESFNLVLKNYTDNVTNIHTDINAISFTNWTGPVATLFSNHVDSMKTGVVTGLYSSISEFGTVRKLKELMTSLKTACTDYIDYEDECLRVDPFVCYKTVGNLKCQEVSKTDSYLSSPDWRPPADQQDLNVDECNSELNVMRNEIVRIMNELKTLRFDSVVSFDEGAYVSVDYELHGEPVVHPAVINQFDKVRVLLPEGDAATDSDIQAANDAYQAELRMFSERSNGRIYIAEIANANDNDESGKSGMQYYDNPADFLRALCAWNPGVDNIDDYIVDGKVTRAGYERILEYSAVLSLALVCTSELIYYDPTGQYYQDFVDSGAFEGVGNSEMYYDRFLSIRCYDTLEDFENAYLEGTDSFLMDAVEYADGGKFETALQKMISLGLVGSAGASTANNEAEMYYLGTDSKGRTYFSYSLDDNAEVYVGEQVEIPGSSRTGFSLSQIQHYDVRVKNILHDPNGTYTSDANFNHSIMYNNPDIAPEVVERGTSSYDPNNAYHMVDMSLYQPISLTEASANGFAALDEHPCIEIKPGEKITTLYGGVLDWDWTQDHLTIGEGDRSVYLCWDEDKSRYYVVDGQGYSTSNWVLGDSYGQGWSYVTLDALRREDTSIVTK